MIKAEILVSIFLKNLMNGARVPKFKQLLTISSAVRFRLISATLASGILTAKYDEFSTYHSKRGQRVRFFIFFEIFL